MDATTGGNVAIIVLGQVRGFASLPVHGSILQLAVRCIGDSDVFVHVKIPSGTRETEVDAVHRAARAIGALSVELAAESDDANVERGSGSCQLRAGSMAWKFLVVSLNAAHAFKTVCAHEARRGRRYEHIVKLRADEQLCSAFPSWRQFSANAVHTWQPLPTCETPGSTSRICHAIDDHVAIVPRALADSFFNAFKEIHGTCLSNGTHREYVPFCSWNSRQLVSRGDVPNECLLGRWLHRMNVTVERGALLGTRNACMVRRTTRSNCNCSANNEYLRRPPRLTCSTALNEHLQSQPLDNRQLS